jgi:hypothetical protein
MAGLLSDVLPAVYSGADEIKRRVKGLLGDPRKFMAERSQDLQTMQDQDTAAMYGLLGAPSSDPRMAQMAQSDPSWVQQQGDLAQQRWLDVAMQGIVSPKVARELGIKPNLPQSEEFARAVANTPGAQVAEDGLLMRVMRNQQPTQALQPSVRGGVFYLPEGSASAKHYSSGKHGYGGSERVSGETLVQNPVFVKGATGGKAPQAAYDELLGKGSYEKMREEALRALRSPGVAWNREQRVADVEEFLSKYAPDMSGMGEYIVMNSPKFNQLPYALQEAAVASAVRRAGHDAVLGYSKGRQGKPEFLSELFDVRESAYPDKFGGYKIHEGLLGR